MHKKTSKYLAFMNLHFCFFKVLLCIGLTLAFPLSAFELKEHSATYTAKIKKGVSIDGQAVRSLTKLKDNKWLYTFEVESFIADIKEKSIITTYSEGIRPLEYDYKLSAFLMPDKNRQVMFDWDAKTATSNIRKRKWQLQDIPNNTYDRLSYQLQLLLDIEKQKTPVIYNVAHKARLKESEFVILGEEKLHTKHGILRSIAAKKHRKDSAKRETYLWFSKDYPLLLLKMTQKEKDGEEYEIELSSAKIEGKEIVFNLSH